MLRLEVAASEVAQRIVRDAFKAELAKVPRDVHREEPLEKAASRRVTAEVKVKEELVELPCGQREPVGCPVDRGMKAKRSMRRVYMVRDWSDGRKHSDGEAQAIH